MRHVVAIDGPLGDPTHLGDTKYPGARGLVAAAGACENRPKPSSTSHEKDRRPMSNSSLHPGQTRRASSSELVCLALGLALVLAQTGCARGGRGDTSPATQTASPIPASPPTARIAAERPAPVLLFPALNVLDLETTEAFYVDLLGMRETLRLGDESTERIEVTLSFGGDPNGADASLVLQRENGRTKPYVFDAFSRVAFRVKDVDALVARIRAAGHPVMEEPHLIHAAGMAIRLAFVQDPNGARVELIEILPGDGDRAK